MNMDTPSKHTTVARMDIPRSGGAVPVSIFSAFMAFFVAVAIFNLVHYELVSLFAIILSALWLLLVVFWIITFILEEGGLRLFVMNLLAKFSAHQFVEIVPQQGDDPIVRFRFTLLGCTFNHLQIRPAELAFVRWSAGQATGLTGRDMDDWHVTLWYNRKRYKRGDDTDTREKLLHFIGPEGPKCEADALGGSLVDFFRSVGLELHPTKNECEFAAQEQDEAQAEPSAI